MSNGLDGVEATAKQPRLERIVPFLTLTVFLDLVGYGIILPLLPTYIRDLGGTPQVIGVLFASFAASQFIATPMLGRTSDRYGRRRVIAISLGANAVAMMLFSLAVHERALWLLFASRILAGVTSGNLGACQAAIADVAEGPARVKAMGKLGAGIGLGIMFGPWIGGRASTLGDAAPPLFAAGMALIALVGVYLFLPETNAAANAPARPRVSLKALGSNPKILIVMALYFLTFLYLTTTQTMLALVATERFHWARERVGDLFGLFGLVSLIMQFGVVGPVSQRVESRTVILGAALIAAGGLATIGLAPTGLVMVAGLVLLAIGMGLTQPQLASLASQYAGQGQQGTVLGLAQSSGSLSRTIGPILWGSLYQHFGGTVAFVGGSIGAILVAGVAAIARNDSRK